MGLVIAAAEIRLVNHRDERREQHRAFGANFLRLVPIIGAIVVGVVSVVIFIQKDARPLRAGWIAADGFAQKAASDGNATFKSFENARNLAPDVERYTLESARILAVSGRKAENEQTAAIFRTRARDILLEYEQRDRFAWETQLELASVTASLALLGNDNLLPEVVSRYMFISTLMEPHITVQAIAAENVVLVGDYVTGTILAERAIALEGLSAATPQAWWTLGEASFQLDRIDLAKLAWEASLKRAPEGVYAGPSHRGLALIAELQGDILYEFHDAMARRFGS
jgi:hypothetical protein